LFLVLLITFVELEDRFVWNVHKIILIHLLFLFYLLR